MEDDMFVGGWRKEGLELFFPAFSLGNPAGGAEPGFAGMEDLLLFPTLRTAILMKPHCLRPAGEHLGNIFPNGRARQKRCELSRKAFPMI